MVAQPEKRHANKTIRIVLEWYNRHRPHWFIGERNYVNYSNLEQIMVRHVACSEEYFI